MNLQKESHFLEDRVSNPALVKCAVKSISKEVRTAKIPVTSNKKAISPSFIRETIARSVHRANNREFASEIPANFQLPAWRISAALVNESPVISFLRKPLSVHKSRDAEPRKHCHTFVRRLSTSSGVWPRSLPAWFFFSKMRPRARDWGMLHVSNDATGRNRRIGNALDPLVTAVQRPRGDRTAWNPASRFEPRREYQFSLCKYPAVIIDVETDRPPLFSRALSLSRAF